MNARTLWTLAFAAALLVLVVSLGGWQNLGVDVAVAVAALLVSVSPYVRRRAAASTAPVSYPRLVLGFLILTMAGVMVVAVALGAEPTPLWAFLSVAVALARIRFLGTSRRG